MSKLCLVRFDNNKYSVMSTVVGRTVDVFAYADRIVIKHNGTVVGEHPRSFARDHVEYNACHYLDVLRRSPVPCVTVHRSWICLERWDACNASSGP